MKRMIPSIFLLRVSWKLKPSPKEDTDLTMGFMGRDFNTRVHILTPHPTLHLITGTKQQHTMITELGIFGAINPRHDMVDGGTLPAVTGRLGSLSGVRFVRQNQRTQMPNVFVVEALNPHRVFVKDRDIGGRLEQQEELLGLEESCVGQSHGCYGIETLAIQIWT